MKTLLYSPTVVRISGVLAGSVLRCSRLAGSGARGGSQRRETAAAMERLHVFVRGAAAAPRARRRCQNAALVVSVFFQDKWRLFCLKKKKKKEKKKKKKKQAIPAVLGAVTAMT